MKFGIRKLESWGYQMAKKSLVCFVSFVLTKYRLVMDRQTDRRTDGRTDRHVAVAKTCTSIASHG